MTIEEKAKAYDEALERAIKILDEILNNELIGFPDQIREIFPELRESDDERIRKALIKLFQECDTDIEFCNTGFTYQEVLDWLEKQKVQKEINLVEILKHYPKETELYSPLYGKLWLAEVDETNEIITCYKRPLEKDDVRATLEQEDTVSFYSNGTTGLPDFEVSKDCMLFLYNNEKQKEQKSLPLYFSVEDVETIKTALRESGLEFASNQKVYDKLEKIPDSAYYLSTVGRSKLYPDGTVARHTIGYIEKQKDANKAIEAVDRIDKYIDEHLANAHDMKDSNPDKKYYRGWDDALGKMAGILQDVYSNEKQKEQKPIFRVGDNIIAKDGTCIPKVPFHIERIEDDCYWDGNGSILICNQDDFRLISQKPAEWSEEDEKIRNLAIEWAETMSGQFSFIDMDSTDFCKIATWLKSLRPSWKPSEEQESVAERFARIVRANLSKIDKEVQQEFEHLYFEITGNKMYGGYHD